MKKLYIVPEVEFLKISFLQDVLYESNPAAGRDENVIPDPNDPINKDIVDGDGLF